MGDGTDSRYKIAAKKDNHVSALLYNHYLIISFQSFVALQGPDIPSVSPIFFLSLLHHFYYENKKYKKILEFPKSQKKIKRI